MQKKITVLNFHNEYSNYQFYKKHKYEEIDFSDLEGVNGYCDETARKKIAEKLMCDDICFMGNGNYHYISYLRISKIEAAFSLVVIDHHTDMQPSFFKELLSCGCWILWALEKQKNLQKVLLIGVKDELADEIPEEYREKVTVIRESELQNETKIISKLKEIEEYPIYLSVDKDGFSQEECITNWDAGSMSLRQFSFIMKELRQNSQIIGADICGEPEEYQLVGFVGAAENANQPILEQILL